MGISSFHFSADSRDDDKVIKHFQDDSNSTPIEYVNKLPNPNPKNFEIINIITVNGYTIMLINYPDCTNYEGNKILVYDKDFDVRILLAIKKIDPHFYSAGDSPIARFEPTERGWNMAVSFAEHYKEE
mgnify:CR=1 FL=1